MQQAHTPGPLRRRGPRPLWLHLTLATPPSIAWRNVLQSWSANSGGPALAAPIFQAGHPGPDADLVAGIAAYRRHPWHRQIMDPPAIWTEGSSRLLDFGPADGQILFVVPSLVNRATVLDLMPGHSMLRFLSSQGIRPLLLDWGYPGALERDFSLSDYIAGRLERALAFVRGPVTLAGYCMGGLMAVAAAVRRPDLIQRLVLLASPWDFWAEGAQPARDLAALLPALEPVLAQSGTLSVDGLQILFSLMEPGSVGAKYRDFGRQDQESDRARMFVAMEDWLNDGIPLAAPVARETLSGWYGRNTPARGDWRVLGMPVDPRALRVKCFVAAPARDRIVPPGSAKALAAQIEGAVLHVPRAGHIGMVAGSTARAALWEPLVAWLRETDAA
jgi:polyhydroxyalkanoate synthase